LLVDDSTPFAERPQIAIREDTKGRILLTGLKQVPINSIEDLLNALNFGSSIRQTDATAINARSSRSHAVFSLNLVQKRSGTPTPLKEKRRSVPLEAMSGNSGADSWITVDSKLHFVDLAGSERLKNTGAQGERAKEGISINAGLASLGKVIAQLSSRAAGSHVSYRDSRLTRLLQDSLGGNAITYMVACVNPAEFHLSETLNTVQYAQRARAIQSKPQIQAVHDDSDKQAVIERLRAEVQFLRDQIRLSEKAERRQNAPQERAERQHERESELQNSYLDLQENYNTLSDRHQKLIMQISKVQHGDTDGAADDISSDSAIERQERSRSFQADIEGMILEYEKTIQSLEGSLSNTRGSLSTTESTLLEKETKIAYLETVQGQLQARLQKAMDREQNDENYLRDLEARFAGATTGEEKSNALVQGLRKELSRARENESSCEEYISTLEERLAEAEQDHDMMQREIERLEHVVERQRSINKLDNLLYELDSIRQTETNADAEPHINGHAKKDSDMSFRSAADSEYSRRSIDETMRSTPERGDAGNETLHAIAEHEKSSPEPEQHTLTPVVTNHDLHIEDNEEPTSPAQSKFVADKLENVTQELFDLRMEHESTITDFDELQRKYQMALKQLAEMHEAREVDLRNNRDSISSRPSTFLADAEVNSQNGEDARPQLSSRTLSSELSSAGESHGQSEISDETAKDVEPAVVGATVHRDERLVQEMEELRKLHLDKELSMAELEERFNQLHEQHQDALDYVEELKAEVQKAQMNGRASPTPHFIRRKSSQIMSSSGDKTNRAFALLRNIALENLEDDVDKLQNFELNLNSVMGELQTRSERVTVLEAEIAALRKEMETKMTIINGLTRERTSLKAAQPLDMSAIASMHDKLKESESRMKQMSNTHSVKERDLLSQIESLRAVVTPTSAISMPGDFPITPAAEMGSPKQLGEDDLQRRRLEQLQREVTEWRSKHDSAMESLKSSEKKFLATINELETKAEQNSRSVSPEEIEPSSGAHEQNIAKLNREVQEHKSNAELNARRLVELEQSYNNIVAQVEDDAHARELTEKELRTHRDLVANLETQLEEHKHAVQSHQQTLEALRSSHAKEIAELNLRSQSGADERLASALQEHKETTAALQQQLEYARSANQEATVIMQAEIENARNQLKELVQDASMVLNKPTNAKNLTSHLLTLVNAKKDIAALHSTATEELQALRIEMDQTLARAVESENKFNELKALNDETMKELEKVSSKELKSARLVQELEDQLNSNYDQTQTANSRLSALQTERHFELEKTVGQLQDAHTKITALEVSLVYLLAKIQN
jgi:chromosome segregation ATPase